MAELDDILDHLDQIHQSGGAIRLLNIYKGLPLNQDSMITGRENNTVMVTVNKMQAACMELQHQTYIQVIDSKVVFNCRVLKVDFALETAVLGAFTYANPKIGNRQTVRVQPAEPLEVEFSSRGKVVRGYLTDISYSGAGVQTAAIFYSVGAFDVNMNASLNLRLPNYPGQVRIPVKLLNVNRLKNNVFRLGMVVFPDSATKIIVSQYVSFRQSEIQREIRTMYDALVRLKNQDKTEGQ